MKKKILFIDRDGTLVIEPPIDYQLDSLEKLEFYPRVFRNLGFIRSKLDFEFVMVTNQDGLGTSSFPEDTFWPAHNLMLKTLAGEGITFDDILIDRSFPEDNAPTRKPRTGMLTKYIDNPEYDLAESFVIGDRPTDVELAKNLGCRAIYLQEATDDLKEKGLEEVCALATTDWDQALGSKRGIERYGYALPMDDCLCQVCLDFGGRPWLVWDAEFNREKIGEMPTEMFLHFFKSLSDAAKMNLNIKAEGQNEHHKIEGIFKALARALKMALKRDIYHFELPSSKGVL